LFVPRFGRNLSSAVNLLAPLTLSRTAGPVGPPAGLVGPLFDIAFEIHFDEVGMFFFEI